MTSDSQPGRSRGSSVTVHLGLCAAIMVLCSDGQVASGQPRSSGPGMTDVRKQYEDLRAERAALDTREADLRQELKVLRTSRQAAVQAEKARLWAVANAALAELKAAVAEIREHTAPHGNCDVLVARRQGKPVQPQAQKAHDDWLAQQSKRYATNEAVRRDAMTKAETLADVPSPVERARAEELARVTAKITALNPNIARLRQLVENPPPSLPPRAGPKGVPSSPAASSAVDKPEVSPPGRDQRPRTEPTAAAPPSTLEVDRDVPPRSASRPDPPPTAESSSMTTAAPIGSYRSASGFSLVLRRGAAVRYTGTLRTPSGKSYTFIGRDENDGGVVLEVKRPDGTFLEMRGRRREDRSFEFTSANGGDAIRFAPEPTE